MHQLSLYPLRIHAISELQVRCAPQAVSHSSLIVPRNQAGGVRLLRSSLAGSVLFTGVSIYVTSRQHCRPSRVKRVRLQCSRHPSQKEGDNKRTKKVENKKHRTEFVEGVDAEPRGTPRISKRSELTATCSIPGSRLQEESAHELERLEDFRAAATKKSETNKPSLEDYEKMRCAAEEMYQALSARSLDRLMTLWSDRHYVQCVHPFKTPCTGYDNVRKHWKELFEDELFSTGSFEYGDMQFNINGSTAILFCNEKFAAKSGGPKEAFYATNIFMKVG